jgi:hypothetical protein
MIQKGSKTQIIDKGGAAEWMADRFEERAAFLEYSCGMTRAEAEAEAAKIWKTPGHF